MRTPGRGRIAAVLIESLFRSHYLKSDEFSQLYYGIRGVLLSARARFGDCPVEIPYGSVELPRDAQIAALIESCRALCAYCRDRTSSRNAELRDAIVAWLKDHYTDMNTYGKSVAIQFSISEKYLYTFFREQVGIGFAAYLENLRIGHAEVLLQDTKLPIQEIARLSGFNSSNTFYKAFLRVNGVSPTKHRTLDRAREA
ncbi:MAG TPA: helix-turn-helix transcriptional regulator [Clostridia bacterium]|nr:helix-turn-helix transcriptional regulator [Clostridia bacterium]